MGEVIAFQIGPRPIAGAGEEIISYIHPTKSKPSRIGLIVVHLSAGTQTGKLCIRYGSADVTHCPEIHKDVFTADEPSVCINPNFVIQPGQQIHIWVWDVSAGDTIVARIEGH